MVVVYHAYTKEMHMDTTATTKISLNLAASQIASLRNMALRRGTSSAWLIRYAIALLEEIEALDDQHGRLVLEDRDGTRRVVNVLAGAPSTRTHTVRIDTTDDDG
jgi:hypothetical protein